MITMDTLEYPIDTIWLKVDGQIFLSCALCNELVVQGPELTHPKLFCDRCNTDCTSNELLWHMVMEYQAWSYQGRDLGLLRDFQDFIKLGAE